MIELLDTTLRDGAQAEGISFSVADKVGIFNLLDDFGVDLIEGGDPSSNPKDCEFFQKMRSDKLVAFSRVRHKDMRASDDEGLKKLLEADTKTVCVFGKASSSQVKDVLNASLEQNLDMISETVAYLKANGKRVLFDAEHFFDGFKEDAGYAMSALLSAADAGADTLVLCDTKGGASLNDIVTLTKKAVAAFPKTQIGVHIHNDTGTAVASTISAVKAGATHVQGTFLGFGERCGNANLSTIIGNLVMKEGCPSSVKIEEMTTVANRIAEISNIVLDSSTPYVGANAFSHKAGMHSDAVLKVPESFEHIAPETVGNKERILLSEFAGRSAVAKKLENLFPSLDKSHPKTKEILDMVKLLEMKGYQFEGADGSFKMLAGRITGSYLPSFELVHYCIKATNPDGMNTAEVSIRVGDTVTTVKQNGNGPVNALDKALRSALKKHFPQINNVALVDYKVRIVDSSDATGAVVRVLITSTDKKDTWTTIGVSTDIIKASWDALCDSFEWKLSHK